MNVRGRSSLLLSRTNKFGLSCLSSALALQRFVYPLSRAGMLTVSFPLAHAEVEGRSFHRLQ